MSPEPERRQATRSSANRAGGTRRRTQPIATVTLASLRVSRLHEKVSQKFVEKLPPPAATQLALLPDDLEPVPTPRECDLAACRSGSGAAGADVPVRHVPCSYELPG